MSLSIAQLEESIAAQGAQIPSMYGRVDLAITPERFTAEPGAQTEIEPEFAALRPALLEDREQVARIKAYTMHGDPVADAYAALIPEYEFHRLIAMLQDACDNGVERVAAAPPELVRFIREMERTPAWIDMELIERGARAERNAYAHRAPYAIRGGFIGTFMNKYSALPMALTGTLSNKTAAHRVHETATFFTTTVMPGALDRHGAGFKAAAMVRLMHSMVRFNALRGDHWDAKIYGIPIPQADQMPVGLLSLFQMAQKALRQGRTAFTPAERAHVELARYRSVLLGLPEELLPDRPQAIVDILLTRHATLRKGYDDTCAALVRATMAADLITGGSLSDRAQAWLERGFSRVYFLTTFVRGDKRAAASVGVRIGVVDYLRAAVTLFVVGSLMSVYALAARLPGASNAVDRALVRKLVRQLARYGPTTLG